MKSYSSRQWLSPTTHSSGYVMCFYDENCAHKELPNFIRIADCHDTFILKRNAKQIKTMIDNVSAIVSVLKGKRTHTRFSIGYRQYIFKLKITRDNQDDFVAKFIISSRINSGHKDKESKRQTENVLVILHADKSTCDKAEWNRKISILAHELEQFILFLQQL